MIVRTHTFATNETANFGVVIDPIVSIDSGTWGGGTLTVYFDGVEVDAGQTDDFQYIYDSSGRVVTMTAILTGATTPSIPVNVLTYGRELS